MNADQPHKAYLASIAVARQFTDLGQYTWFAEQVTDDAPGLMTGPYANPAASPFAAPPAR